MSFAERGIGEVDMVIGHHVLLLNSAFIDEKVESVQLIASYAVG